MRQLGLQFGNALVAFSQRLPHLGRLKRILVAHESATLPIHVLHREGRQASAKVRSFVDFLVGDLRERLGGIEI